jgi:hypothetical protein
MFNEDQLRAPDKRNQGFLRLRAQIISKISVTETHRLQKHFICINFQFNLLCGLIVWPNSVHTYTMQITCVSYDAAFKFKSNYLSWDKLIKSNLLISDFHSGSLMMMILLPRLHTVRLWAVMTFQR